MGDWGLVSGARAQFLATSGTYSVTVTSSASVNVKGTYSAISNSVPFDAEYLQLNIVPSASGQRVYLYDIAVGLAGSEVVVAANLPMCGQTAGHFFSAILPIPVRRGTRIAVRAQCDVTAQPLLVNLAPVHTGYMQAWPTLSNLQVYGVTSSGATLLTTVTPPVIAGAKSAWTQIVGSTTRPIRLLILYVSGATVTAQNHSLDVGVGPAGLEVTYIADVHIRSTSSGGTIGPSASPYPASIPVGTRLAVRLAASSTNGDPLEVAIIGVE